MSEQVLLGHSCFHKIIGKTERGEPKTDCGAHKRIQHRLRVLPRHQASVFRDKCGTCYE